MNLKIETLSHEPLKFTSDLPLKFPGPRLPGGEVLSAKGDFGDLCIQEFDGGNFIIRYSVLQLKEPFVIDVESYHSGVHASIMLKSNMMPQFNSGEEIKLHEGQFTIFQAYRPSAKINLEGKQQVICFEALLSHEMAASVLEDFPELSSSIHDVPPNKPDFWVKPEKWADDEVREHIRYILSYSDPVKWRRNYFENRVWDIVWKLLAIHINKLPSEHPLKTNEREKASIVERLIIDNLDKHMLIRELAKKVALSESKMKRIFSQVYGMGIHEYRIYQRLKKAIQLLNEGFSVKEAAAHTGWRPADLINAYNKVYGTTPGTIKRKK